MRRPGDGLVLGDLFRGPDETQRAEWAKAGLSAVGQWLRWLTEDGCAQSGGTHVPGPLGATLARYAVRGIEAEARRNGTLPQLPPGLTDLLRQLASSDQRTGPATMPVAALAGAFPGGAWVTTPDAASRSGVSMSYLERLARQGRIRACRMGRAWLFDEAAVEGFARDRRARASH